VTLKQQKLQQYFKFEIEVLYPSLPLPFIPTELTATPDGTKILFSNATPQPHLRERDPFGKRPRVIPQLGILDAKTGKVLAEKKLAPGQRVGALNNEWVLLLQEDPTRGEILGAATLAKHKTLWAKTPIDSARRYWQIVPAFDRDDARFL
jgi:hypothetical protein